MTKTFMKSWRSLASALVLLAAANACGSGTISGGDNTPVAGLRFSVQPASGAAGATFTVSVELLNSAGQKIANADDVVTLTVNGGADLLGTLTKAAVSGVATFTGLSVTRAGAGITISAAAGGFSATSSSFTIAPGAANAGQSSATFTPSTVTTGATIAVVFTFKDQYGNPLPSKTVTLSSSLAGVTFTPSTGTTSATGTFSTNMVATGAGSATLSATVDGVVIALPTAVTITAGATNCTVTPLTFPGTANGSVSSAVCVSDNLASAFFRFTTPTAGAHTFSLTTSFNGPSIAVVQDPPGTFVAFTNSGGTTAGTDWLLPAGTYQVRAAALTATSGTFTVTGAVGALNNTTCNIRALLVSITITQTLAATDCPYAPGNDGTVEDRFAIYSARNCTITLTGSAAAPPYVELRDAAAPTVGLDGGGVGGLTASVSRSPCISPTGGPLIIAANTYNTVADGGVGSYTLQLTLSGTAALRAYDSPWLDVSAMSTQAELPRGGSMKRTVRR